MLALTRSDFPAHNFHHFRGYRWIREQYRTCIQGKKHVSSCEKRGGPTPRARRTFSTSLHFDATVVSATIRSFTSTTITWRMRCLRGYKFGLLLCIYAIVTLQASFAMLGDFIRSGCSTRGLCTCAATIFK
jgi:hypothetical protein